MQAECPSCRPIIAINSVKAPKGKLLTPNMTQIFYLYSKFWLDASVECPAKKFVISSKNLQKGKGERLR